jgi:putative endonuclease
MRKEYFVYIMTNKSKTLYTGVTNNLMRRVYEHKKKLVRGFTSKYNIHVLVYYESTSNVYAALAREKQIKGWLRATPPRLVGRLAPAGSRPERGAGEKIALINSLNPDWKDLSEEWFSQ